MIPKEWEGSNYYQVLGVSPSASFSQIKAAYRQLAQQLHPDRNQGQIGPTEFQQLSQAYKVLSKEKSRALYDDYLFGATQIPIREPEPKQSFLTKYRELLIRAAVIISLLVLVAKLGFFSPKQIVLQNNSAKINPEIVFGKDGADGKDGKNGLNGKDGVDGMPGAIGPAGLNGQPGKDGSPGANGASGAAGAQGIAGLAGQSVTVTSISTSDASKCSGLGGVLLTGSSGSFQVCNGSAGSGSSGSYGTGQFQLSACDTSISMSLKTSFDGSYFKMSAIELSNLSDECNGKVINLVLKVVKSSDTPATTYTTGDAIECVKTFTGLSAGADANTVRISDSTADCRSFYNSKIFSLSDIYALDISSQAAGLAIQIAS